MIQLVRNYVIQMAAFAPLIALLLRMKWRQPIPAVRAYNDPLAYADLILNGDPEAYLNAVTEYKPYEN